MMRKHWCGLLQPKPGQERDGDAESVYSRVFFRQVTAVVAAIVLSAGAASAQTKSGKVRSGVYIPTIWVDPDGCEHWVMDGGWEGFMTPHVTRDGKPVCRSGNLCGDLSSDQLFATNRHSISSAGRRRIEKFFRDVDARGFIITGHTDSRASDAYNLALSQRRADAVASIARAAGANVVDARGYGERTPKASNRTASGMRLNRRVEIICVHSGG